MSFFSIQQLRYLNFGPVDLELDQGEIAGLYGASGTGKSRLLRALADLDDHQGEVFLVSQKQEGTRPCEWRTKVALLPAETYWWFDTVAEHFNHFPVEEAKLLGFDPSVGGWQVSRLSSGEKQRLGLLRLLENKPQVLLLDEPTANLDETNTGLFEKFVQKYIEAHRACAIWVSHDTKQLGRIAKHVYQLRSGEILAEEVC